MGAYNYKNCIRNVINSKEDYNIGVGRYLVDLLIAVRDRDLGRRPICDMGIDLADWPALVGIDVRWGFLPLFILTIFTLYVFLFKMSNTIQPKNVNTDKISS